MCKPRRGEKGKLWPSSQNEQDFKGPYSNLPIIVAAMAIWLVYQKRGYYIGLCKYGHCWDDLPWMIPDTSGGVNSLNRSIAELKSKWMEYGVVHRGCENACMYIYKNIYIYIECFHISRHLSTDFPPQNKISLPRLKSYLNKVQPWHRALPQLQGSFITCSWGNITHLKKSSKMPTTAAALDPNLHKRSHGIPWGERYEGRVISFLKTSWQACSQGLSWYHLYIKKNGGKDVLGIETSGVVMWICYAINTYHIS